MEHKPKQDYTTTSVIAHVEERKLLVVGVENARYVHGNAVKKEGAGGGWVVVVALVRC